MDTVTVLRHAREAGFEVDVSGDKLTINGPRNRTDILDELRANKSQIIDAIQHPPPGVEHIKARLRSGIDWLEACLAKLEVPRSPEVEEKMIDAFTRNLHRWADLDSDLRQTYPEFRGCPLDGCNPEAPVICLDCME